MDSDIVKKRSISSFEDIEEGITVVAVVLLLGYSVIGAIWSLPSRWLAPAILLSVTLVLRLLWRLRSVDDEIKNVHKTLGDTYGNVNKILAAVASGRDVVVPYPSVGEFYSAVTAALRQATSKMESTYIRRAPPSQLTNAVAREFFDYLLDWARQDGHVVRRIFCRVTDDPQQAWQEWLSEHYRATQDLGDKYAARVLHGWPTGVELINFAVVDDTAVYLLITGSQSPEVYGIGIHSDSAAKYFATYHRALYETGTPLAIAVRQGDVSEHV